MALNDAGLRACHFIFGQPLNELSTARTASRSPMSPITRLGKSGLRIGAYVEIALGVRDANALLLKQSPDLVKDLALDVMDAILGVRDPEPQLEFYRGLAEGHDQGVRGRHRQDALRIARRLVHQGERLIE